MDTISFYFRKTATYQIWKLLLRQIEDFFVTLGEIAQRGIDVFKYIFTGQIDKKEVIEQCHRFGITSLPITLSIVGMSSIIVAMQVAGEMVKQGGGNFVGMLITILIVREDAVIMSGFALISMIGSSLASEVATMKVSEQLDAMRVLKVDPIRYLFVPRVLSGILMTPFVVIIASVVGILCGAVASKISGDLSFRAFFDSVSLGLYIKDMNVCLAKAVCFGALISLISCSCGYSASGGAKGVGLATTKAVVWSFIAIAFCDLVFAALFFF